MKYALIIACEYGGEIDLKDAEWNLEKVYNVIINGKGYDPANLTICSDIPANKLEKYSRAGSIVPATEKSILVQISEVIRKLKDGDILFFYFSGHGISIPDKNFDEEDGRDECILSSDGVPIVDDYLYENMVLKVPKGAKMIAIVDACHSGTILDIPIVFHSGGRDGVGPRKPRFRSIISRLFSRRKPVPHKVGLTFQISSCLDHELAQARSKYLTFGKGFGLFTKHCMNAIKRLDETSTYKDAMKYVYEEAGHLTQQHFVVCMSHEIYLNTPFAL